MGIAQCPLLVQQRSTSGHSEIDARCRDQPSGFGRRMVPTGQNGRQPDSMLLLFLDGSGLSPLGHPFHQKVRNGETEYVYSRSNVFPLRRAIAPEHVAGMIGILDKWINNREPHYACDDCLARLQYLMPLWLFHRGSW